MAVELMKKQVQLNEMAEKEMIQIVKERDLIVPDGKPDMQRVMYLDGKINIDQIDVQEGRVVYKGQVEITVLYVPENNPHGICKMKGTIPLEDFIILEGINPSKKVEFNYQIEHLYWNVLNERKLNVKAIICIDVNAVGSKDVNIVTDATGDTVTQTQMKEMEVVKPTYNGQDSQVVKDELTIPQNKSSIDEIYKVNTVIQDDQVKRTEDEMIYNGMIEVSVLYKGQGDDAKVEVSKHLMPFNGSIRVPKSDNEVGWDYEMSVTPSYMQVNPDYDGEDRLVEMECIVSVKYSTYDNMTEMIVDDIYCPGKKVAITDNKESYMTLTGRAQMKTPKKEIMALDGMIDDVEKIFSIEMKPIIDEQEVQGDKLTLSGMLEVKIVYVTDDEMNKIQTIVEMIPFSEQIQINGMNQDSMVNVAAKPKNVNMSTYNKNDMVLEYIMDYAADAYNEEEVKVIEQVEVDEIDKDEMNKCPSITVYVVKKGDTLWSLAKRYNTTVQDIMEINDIESNAIIYPGQKLIILKKNKF